MNGRDRQKFTQPIDISFWQKNQKPYNGNKKISSIKGAGLPGCQHVEEGRESYIYHPAPNSSRSRSKTSK